MQLNKSNNNILNYNYLKDVILKEDKLDHSVNPESEVESKINIENTILHDKLKEIIHSSNQIENKEDLNNKMIQATLGDLSKHLEEELEILKGNSEIAEVGSEVLEYIEESSEILEYLQTPLYLMARGFTFAQKLELMESSEEGNLIASALSTGRGAVGYFGAGLDCYAIQKRVHILRLKENEISRLIEKIQNLPNQDQIISLNNEILALEEDIKEMKTEIKEKVTRVALKFALTSLRTPAAVLELLTSTHILEAESEMIEKLLFTSENLLLVASIVTWSWNCYQVVKSTQHLLQTNKHIKQLETIKTTLKVENVYIAYIINAKLDHLKKVKHNYHCEIGLKVSTISAQSLMVASSASSLLSTSGLALGATAGAILAGLGTAGIAIMGGTFAVGTGRLIYNKRHYIKNSAELAPLYSEEFLLKSQLFLTNQSQKQVLKKINDLEINQNKIQNKLRNIYLSPQSESIFQPDASSSSIHEKMNRMQMKAQIAFNRMQSIADEMNDAILHVELIQNEKNQLATELQNLRQKKQEIHKEMALNEFQSKFKTLDPKTLGIIKSVINEGMEDPKIRLSIQQFLISELHNVKLDFETEDVIKYILTK